MHTLALGFVKLSFVLFYRRVLSTGKSSIFRRAVVVMIWLIALWTISFFVAFLFACKGHFADWWTSLETLVDNCVEFELLYYGFALSDVIMDMIIIIMPIPTVGFTSSWMLCSLYTLVHELMEYRHRRYANYIWFPNAR